MNGSTYEEDVKPDIVSSPRQQINYANGMEYAAPPLTSQPYEEKHYGYSDINNKKYVVVCDIMQDEI